MDERDFPQANDWLLFGFLMFSVSSSWDWRNMQQRADMKDRDTLFPTLKELEGYLELPFGAFVIVSDFLYSHFNPSLHCARKLDRVSSQLRELEELPWGKWAYSCDKGSEPSEKDSAPSA